MAKFQEANTRKFKDIFVCRKCKSKIRTPNRKVLSGNASCRKCDSKALRPVRKK